MKPVITAADIRHHITNQLREYGPHPFKRNGAGLDAFSRLYPVMRRLPPKRLANSMQLIDSMRATHVDCESCTLKILAFSILFTLDRLPERSQGYAKIYQEVAEKFYRSPGPGRDYMAEVLDAINRECIRAAGSSTS